MRTQGRFSLILDVPTRRLLRTISHRIPMETDSSASPSIGFSRTAEFHSFRASQRDMKAPPKIHAYASLGKKYENCHRLSFTYERIAAYIRVRTITAKRIKSSPSGTR